MSSRREIEARLDRLEGKAFDRRKIGSLVMEGELVVVQHRPGEGAQEALRYTLDCLGPCEGGRLVLNIPPPGR